MKNALITIAIAAVIVLGGSWLATRNNDMPEENSPDLHADETSQSSGQSAVNEDTTPTTTTDTEKIMNATLHTNKGDITLELFTEQTPVTTANFIKLVESGFYDEVKFHRVIKDFMIQGGDPLSKDDSMVARWGTGGPGYAFKDEITAKNSNARGTISMANSGPNTNGSQFFINVADNNFLDPKHTVFGRIIAGMDVVEAIENTPTGPSDRPVDPVIITSITLK